MTIKTPLRYPGGKHYMVKQLLPYIPDFEEFREPFVGGGSMLMSLLSKYPERKFWINDIYYNLYCFWVSLKENPDMIETLLNIKLNNKEQNAYIEAKENINLTDNIYQKGLYFYILNKCSFSGLTETGNFNKSSALEKNFTISNINKLRNIHSAIQKVKITNLDYTELLIGETSFIYLDPPYDINIKNGKGLYGKNGEIHEVFDHNKFYENVNKSKNKLLISYNNSTEIMNKFIGFNISTTSTNYHLHHKNNIVGDKKTVSKSELIIRNY